MRQRLHLVAREAEEAQACEISKGVGNSGSDDVVHEPRDLEPLQVADSGRQRRQPVPVEVQPSARRPNT